MCDDFVNDIVPENKSKIKYIFIFESPHNTEVSNGIPVSGSTGKYILKQLGLCVKNDISFGKFALNRYDIAILNVSNYPLQEINSDRRSELNDLKFIRNNYTSLLRHRCCKKNEIEQVLIDCLKKRLDSIYGTDIDNKKRHIVVCGKFAEAYFKQAKPNTPYIYMPHPSRSGWSNLNDCQKNFFKNSRKHYYEHLSTFGQ